MPSPVNRNSTEISAAQADAIAYSCMVSSAYNEFFSNMFMNYNGHVDPSRLAKTPSYDNTADGYTPYPAVITESPHKQTHKFQVTTDISLLKTDTVGIIGGYFAYGYAYRNGLNLFARPVSNLSEGVVQSIFGHSSTSLVPFFDNTNQQSGDGTIAFSGDGTWTDPDFPKLYRLDVTGTGALGVGTYQFQVRNHFGFALNNYIDPIRMVSTLMEENKHLHDGMLFTVGNLLGDAVEDKYRPTIIKYDVVDNTLKHLLAISKTEVYPFNIQTGEADGPLFNVTNYPTFNPTNITQVTFDSSGTIYVGCRDSGIYKIADPLGTPVITVINNTTSGLTGLAGSPNETKCYGVIVGNSRLWAVFEGGLFSSADDGATWSNAAGFTNTIITNDWWRVKFIQADPTHADQRLMFCYEDATSSTVDRMYIGTIWWDETSTNDIQGRVYGYFHRGSNFASGYSSNIRYIAEEPWTWFTLISPSPTQNKWGMTMPSSNTTAFGTKYISYIDFGADTFTQNVTTATSTKQFYIDWELSEDGLDQQIIALTSVSTSDASMTLYKDDNTWLANKFIDGTSTLTGNLQYVYEGAACYLGKLVTLSYYPSGAPQRYHMHVAGDRTSPTGGALDFILWDKYGWNGASWELDHAGSKDFHGASEVLNDGVFVSFDDAGGTQSFTATDFYTCGLVQGVWLDGATTITHKTGINFKNLIGPVTDLESGILSASIRSPEIFELAPSVSMTWQDLSPTAQVGGDTLQLLSADLTYGAGARSIEKIGGTGITNKSTNDTIHGRFRFNMYSSTTIATDRRLAVGLSPATVLGTAINKNAIAYGIEFLPVGGANTEHASVNIIESGVTVAAAVRTIDTDTYTNYTFEIEILNNGEVNYYLWSDDITTELVTRNNKVREKLHTTIAGTAPTVDYYVDVAINGGSTPFGMQTTAVSGPDLPIWPYPVGPYTKGGKRFTTRVTDDHYLTIGSFGGSTGRYSNNFWAIDTTQNFNVVIDGAPVTLILEDDTTTVLLAGEISVFARQGFIRYSGFDTGKTITASYNVLLTE